MLPPTDELIRWALVLTIICCILYLAAFPSKRTWDDRAMTGGYSELHR